MKAILYFLIALIAFIFFKRDPLLVLFIVGAYLLYRFLAGNTREIERAYYTSMTQMALVVSKTMNQIILNLDQMNASIDRINKPSHEAFITDSDSEEDEFEHLA